MKIWSKKISNTDGWEIKRYNLFGVQVLKKSKKNDKKILKFIGFIKLHMRNLDAHHFAPNNIPEQKPKQKIEKIKDDIISLETIKNIIATPSVRVVSFDIFDTLLLRPVIKPTDLFYLIDAKLQKTHKINFIKYRLNAEAEMNNPNANLDDIYLYIQKKYNLSNKTIQIMKDAELKCEFELLGARHDMQEVYEFAVQMGKRIIATSDMYLSSKFLRQVLKKCGYDKIEHVYVSNEHHARKDSGKLYQIVVDAENVAPHNVVHIGDNFESDFKNSIKNGIIGIYYPSIHDIIHKSNAIYNQIYLPSVSPDPMCRILMGYTFNYYFQNLSKIKDSCHALPDFIALAELSIAPVLTYIALSIANNRDIQNNYETILFASRDGYLPQLAYDELSKYMPNLRPSKYIHAGRRAYFSATDDDFVDLITNSDVNGNRPFTISNLLNAYIHDKNLISKIINSLSETERQLDLRTQKSKIKNVLNRFRNELNQYKKAHEKQSRKYYESVRTNSPREIIFDCGYSGSVSVGLTKMMNKPVDKIYLWETLKNQERDKQNGTKTYVLMHEFQMFTCHNIVYEELFSPCAPGCIGFHNNKPAFEYADFSAQMQNDLNLLKTSVLQYISGFSEVLKNYLPYISIIDTNAMQITLWFAMTKSPFNESHLLDNIKFADPVYCTHTYSLAYKVQENITRINVFDNTGFNNPDNYIDAVSIPSKTKIKLGIHCHLYNVYLYQELLQYLKDFPMPFDLILTICSSNQHNILKSAFTKSNIKNLNNLTILVVENRGRDVAPWLISMCGIHEKYDLFCHIHGKVSSHLQWGNEWRRYLFNNLIRVDSVIDIINIFKTNNKIGCVFPDTFKPLKDLCVQLNINQIGVYGEKDMIHNILNQMNFDVPFSECEMYFSEGTMMWYRPAALKPLFDLKLKYSDFPAEPIAVGGTIAHAIERLPAFICNHNGYTAKIFTKYKS